MNITKCRMCGSGRLHNYLDLGRTPPADQFLFADQIRCPEEAFPLRVVICDDCGLNQLDFLVPPELLYCNHYPYESSMTAAGKRHWDEFADTTTRMLGLSDDDLVVDIGSNVGTLLHMFKKRGTNVLGVDPAANIAEIANKGGIDTIPAFFNSATAADIVASRGRARVITGTNVFAHVGDLHDFMNAVERLLSDDGAFIIEAPYFVDLLQNLEYDTIYHEHLSYLSIKPLKGFFARYSMEIFDVQRRDIHGGSFRIFVRRRGSGDRPPASVIDELLAAENRAGIYEHERLHRFASEVDSNRRQLRDLLLDLKRRGKRIAGVSAPAKGMTLLNYCGIGGDILDFVTEKSRLKIGRYTPGGHIPVVEDGELIARKVDYALLLAWNFAEEIMSNLAEYSAGGGKFIIPIPTPRIVG